MLSSNRSRILGRLTVGILAGTLLASAGIDAADATDVGGPARSAQSARSIAVARLAPSATVTVTGHGWGHGHGLSQWGAQGAAKKGKSYAQILSFYYPHTAWGRSGGKIRALIVEDTSRDVVVQARSGLTAKALTSGRTWKLAKTKPKAGRWRIVPVSAGRNRLDFKKSGHWHHLKTVTGKLQFDAGGKPIRLYLPHGSASYRGVLRSAAPKAGTKNRDTVNIVSLDNYLRSVVPSEAYSSWKPAALKAQAVAARTYAAYQRAHRHRGYFDVYDTTSDQAYHGVSVETASTSKAVAATAGRIRTYRGAAAFTQFSASNGGYLLAGGKPYLVSKADPYDTKASGDPNLNWTRKLTVRQFMDRFSGGNPIASIKVLSRVADTGGRYVKTVRVLYADGRHNDIPGDTVKSWAGLKSTWFNITTG